MNSAKSRIRIGTVFLCHDGAGQILLAKRTGRARDEHGRWDPGAGEVEHGEGVLETLNRELTEEFSATPAEILYLGHREVFRTKTDHWIMFDHLVLVNPQEVAIREPHKLSEIGWFTFDKLPEPMHSQWPVFYNKYKAKLHRRII